MSTVKVRVAASEVLPSASAATIPTTVIPSGSSRVADQSPFVSAVALAASEPYVRATTKPAVVVPVNVADDVAYDAPSEGELTASGTNTTVGGGLWVGEPPTL